jgi:hypothetical protein
LTGTHIVSKCIKLSKNYLQCSLQPWFTLLTPICNVLGVLFEIDVYFHSKTTKYS